jgi:epidermal growth factor receptor substrate 15
MTNYSIDDVVSSNQTVYDVYFSQVSIYKYICSVNLNKTFKYCNKPKKKADSTGSGVIGALDVNSFLKQSKVKDAILKEIWDLADPTGKGYLDRHGFYVNLKLVALAQSNQEVKLDNLTVPAPPPKLVKMLIYFSALKIFYETNFLNNNLKSKGELSSNITSLISPGDPWYIKASLRISYDKVFDSLSPINNKITGARVKPVRENVFG